MFDFLSKRPARLAFGIVVATAALTLAACGHSNHDGGDTTLPPVGGTPTQPVVDSFITVVKGVISVTNETAEPSPIDSVTATAPETTSPDETN